MTDADSDVTSWLDERAGLPYAYLTTIGRRTGQLHRIEIWFAVHNGRIYLMSGGRDRSDWVKNVMADGQVWIELDGQTRPGTARAVPADSEEDRLARNLLVEKYATPGNPLENWKKWSLPLVIEFSVDSGGSRCRRNAS